MNEDTDRILELKNTFLAKMHAAIDAIGVASFHGDTDMVDNLMFDLETYRMIIEKYDHQMVFALASAR